MLHIKRPSKKRLCAILWGRFIGNNIKNMYKTINESDFTSWFSQSDTYKNNFSYEGLQTLFNYLEDYEEDTDEKIEFDPIALCCEYAEYPSAFDCAKEYGHDTDALKDTEEQEQDALEWLEDRTVVIRISLKGKNTGVIIQQF